MAGLGRGGRGRALLEALNQPVRKPGVATDEVKEEVTPSQPQVERDC